MELWGYYGRVYVPKLKINIEITELEDGRFQARYINKADRFIDGIYQYGKTAVEAQVNVMALVNAVKREQLKTNIIISGV